MAILSDVILKILMALMAMQIVSTSEIIQFFYVNHQIETTPAPRKRQRTSIPRMGMGPILQLLLRNECLMNL